MIPLATPILQERAEVEAKSKIAVVTHLQDFNFYLKQFKHTSQKNPNPVSTSLLKKYVINAKIVKQPWSWNLIGAPPPLPHKKKCYTLAQIYGVGSRGVFVIRNTAVSNKVFLLLKP